MRDQKIETLLSYAGNEHRYQYFVLIIFFCLWMNCNFMAVVLPYLEREPLVKLIDRKNKTLEGVLPYLEKEPLMNIDGKNKTQEGVSLTNDICNKTYEILERFRYSWVSEFGFECNKFKIGLIGVFTFLGNSLGSIAFSIVTKYLNYKNILLISIVGFSISIFVCTLVNSVDNFYWILISLNFVGLFGNLLCYASLFITEEIVSSRRRSNFSSIINTGYSFCGIMYSFIFKYVQNWRYDFYILIGLSLLIGVVIWIFIYGSPRTYINKGDEETTLKILERIASFNGKKDDFLEEIESEEGKELIKEIIEYNIGIEIGEIVIDEDEKDSNTLLNKENKDKNNKIEEKITACSNFKYPSLRYKFLILCVIWFGTRATSNCISLSSKSLPGDYYLNIIILFIFESISYNINGILINIKCLGRKRTLWAQYLIITTIFILLGFVDFSDNFKLILNFFARFCAAGIESVYWAYTLEVYPTPVRSTNFGINVTCGNIGSILSPMAFEYMPTWLFFLIFGLLSVFHSFLLIFLPETVGKPMVESIEELTNKQ